jgi:hypothetical protein
MWQGEDLIQKYAALWINPEEGEICCYANNGEPVIQASGEPAGWDGDGPNAETVVLDVPGVVFTPSSDALDTRMPWTCVA